MVIFHLCTFCTAEREDNSLQVPTGLHCYVKSRPNLYQYYLIFYHIKSNWPLILSCTYHWRMRKNYQEIVNLWNMTLHGLLTTHWLWGTTNRCCISTRRTKGDKVIIVNARVEEDVIPFPQVLQVLNVICEGHPTTDPSRRNYIPLKAEKEEKYPVLAKVLTEHHELSDGLKKPKTASSIFFHWSIFSMS